MGIFDRDYMKRPRNNVSNLRVSRRGWWIWVALVVVVVIGIVASVHYKKSTRPLAEGSQLVNINTATVRELESLPGIGPAKAQLIILGRPYANVTDLSRIRGISENQVEQMRPLLTVTAPTRERQPKSVWQRVVEWARDLSRFSIFGYSVGTLVAVYFLFPWIRRMWRRHGDFGSK